jgi:hypothetical protein
VYEPASRTEVDCSSKEEKKRVTSRFGLEQATGIVVVLSMALEALQPYVGLNSGLAASTMKIESWKVLGSPDSASTWMID